MSTRTPTNGSTRVRQPAKSASAPARAEDLGYEPVRLTKRTGKPVDRLPVFYVDDVEYSMPARVEFGDAVKLQNAMNLQPTELQKAFVLVSTLCGEEAFRAMENDASMTDADFEAVLKILSDHALGQLERFAARGN
jgi:hypothetical protein